MVEQTLSLDLIFQSFSDQTRRDILNRLVNDDLTISEIAQNYHLTFAAISKHLMVLEKAKLVVKRRIGKKQLVSLSPQAFAEALDYISFYEQILKSRLDSLDNYLNKEA